MKMVAVYLAKAAEFKALAHRFDEASAKKPYLDMADAYRLLAEDRKRHVDDKKLGRKVPPQTD
jgi:hypothetical protein